MTEPALMEHIERHRSRWHLILGCKGETRLRIDQASDQPRGSAAVHSGSRPRDPHPALVVFRVDLLAAVGLRYPRHVRLLQ